MTVAETWHAFMIRKTLLTHWSVCFEFSMPGATFRDPIIRNTAASSLYVDLLSLLDEAIETHMSPEDYDRGQAEASCDRSRDGSRRAVVTPNDTTQAILEHQSGGQFAPEEPHPIALLHGDPVKATQIGPGTVRRSFTEDSSCVSFPHFRFRIGRPPAFGIREVPRFNTKAVLNQGVAFVELRGHGVRSEVPEVGV